MSIEVTMPVLGLTMEEGTVAEWLKREGEPVAKDEPLLLVEMDKGTVEVPAPAAGVLQRIIVPIGVTVPVKTLIAHIATGVRASESGLESVSGSETAFRSGSESRAESAAGSAAGPASAATLPAGSGAAATTARVDSGATTVAPEAARADAGASASSGTGEARAGASAASGGGAAGVSAMPRRGGGSDASSAAVGGRERQFVTPRARLRARELGVDVAQVRGSGPHGRVVEADVIAAATASAPAPSSASVASSPNAASLRVTREVEVSGLVAAESAGSGAAVSATENGGRDAAAGVGPAAAPSQSAVAGSSAASSEAATEVGSVEAMGRLRRITAERMLASTQATARVTLFLDADFSEAARFRRQLQPEFARLGVAKLPWDALIAKAAALALVEHRAMARQWVGEGRLRQLEVVNVGVAVALEPEGLVVPVLRSADIRSLRELAAELVALTEKARAYRLTAAEMHGGTFTITNLGAYRIDGFTPIINPPETAILGVGRIADKATVIDGHVEVRTMSTLSLSFDHRLVDGAPAAAFLARLAELLERPYALLGI